MNINTKSIVRARLSFWMGAACSFVWVVSQLGCSTCCGPYDYDYPVLGGPLQRANPTWGRVGSIFSDPYASQEGPSADSNLGDRTLEELIPSGNNGLERNGLPDPNLRSQRSRDLPSLAEWEEGNGQENLLR